MALMIGVMLACGLMVGVVQQATVQSLMVECGPYHGPWSNTWKPTKARLCVWYNLQADGFGFVFKEHAVQVENGVSCPPDPANDYCLGTIDTWIENASGTTKWRSTTGQIGGACGSSCSHYWTYNDVGGEVLVNTNTAQVTFVGAVHPSCQSDPEIVCSHGFSTTVTVTR